MTSRRTTFSAATRMQLVCPAGNPDLTAATNTIIAMLLAEQRIRDWGGFTFSNVAPPVFSGFFWHTYSNEPERNVWDLDQNVLILIDVIGYSADALVEYFT